MRVRPNSCQLCLTGPLCKLPSQILAVRVANDLQERDRHREDHPHVDHLDVRCRWKGARDANVAENVTSKLVADLVSQTSQEFRMLSRSLFDCKSLLLNVTILNLNRCLCSHCSQYLLVSTSVY